MRIERCWSVAVTTMIKLVANQNESGVCTTRGGGSSLECASHTSHAPNAIDSTATIAPARVPSSTPASNVSVPKATYAGALTPPADNADAASRTAIDATIAVAPSRTCGLRESRYTRMPTPMHALACNQVRRRISGSMNEYTTAHASVIGTAIQTKIRTVALIDAGSLRPLLFVGSGDADTLGPPGPACDHSRPGFGHQLRLLHVPAERSGPCPRICPWA
jgi:hypothetical protein